MCICMFTCKYIYIYLSLSLYAFMWLLKMILCRLTSLNIDGSLLPGTGYLLDHGLYSKGRLLVSVAGVV